MNQYAVQLGMNGTQFVNSSGLPHPDHFTTARDMATLARSLIAHFPELYKLHAIKEFVFNDITQRNRNRLLWSDPSVDGLKTGHTESAGYCLVASAMRDEMRLVTVVMGAPSTKTREQQTQSLLNYGFRFYETHRVYGAMEPVTRVRIWQGDVEQLGVGLPRDLYVTVPRGQYKNLDAKMDLDARVVAPVAQGAGMGTLRISLGEDAVAERQLVSLQAVAKGSLWRQVSDYVRLLFE